MKLQENKDKKTFDQAFKSNQERLRTIEKGSVIVLAVFIISFLYSLGLLPRYCHTKGFESIISSIIVSSIFTCIIGFLVGKYLTRQSKTKQQKEFNK
jgi:uncharacterized membrane protein